MDYEMLQKERITSTQVQPYDMITAITQRTTNNQLAKMHEVNPALQRMSVNLAELDDDFSAFEADLDPPTIELRLGTENHAVILSFNIKRATLKYLKIQGRSLLEEKLELPSCVLSLSVNLTVEGVGFEKLPENIQNRLAGRHDGVHQLLVDFTSASHAPLDMHRSTILGHIQDARADLTFRQIIQKYFAELGKKNDYALHYLPLASMRNRNQSPMPSVLPVDFSFQNVPFRNSSTDNGNASDNNMLVYFQMTQNTALPRELAHIPANWVVPGCDKTESYDGTVALSRKIFLEGWFLPQLAELNKQSTYVVTDAWWRSTGIGSPEYRLNGHLGRDDATTDELLFRPVSKGEVDRSVFGGLEPDAPGHWYQYKFDSRKDDDAGLWRVWLAGSTNNYIFIPEGYNKDGKCEILLAGTTSVRFHVHVDIPLSTGWVEGKWSSSIIFDGTNDGELVIKVGDIVPQMTQDIDDAWLHKDSITQFVNPAKEGMSRLQMPGLGHAMGFMFTNGWNFVLPGAGGFYIKKAVFNKEEDLLFELKYL